MKQSNWILIIGVAIALILVGSWSLTTGDVNDESSNTAPKISMEKAKKAATEVAFKPIWQVSKRIIRFD